MREEDAKIVKKPWGREVWLREPTEEEKRAGRGYCYKRIYINQGTRTSYQYHERKMETNFVISGSAEVWLENEAGVVEKTVMGYLETGRRRLTNNTNRYLNYIQST